MYNLPQFVLLVQIVISTIIGLPKCICINGENCKSEILIIISYAAKVVQAVPFSNRAALSMCALSQGRNDCELMRLNELVLMSWLCWVLLGVARILLCWHNPVNIWSSNSDWMLLLTYCSIDRQVRLSVLHSLNYCRKL